MALTASSLEPYLSTVALGGPLPPAVQLLNIANECGDYLANFHPWSWLRKRPLHLDTRASIAFAAGTLDATGKLLTLPALTLTDHKRVIGDEVELESGTDGTGTFVPGFYEVLAINTTTQVVTLRTAATNPVGTATAIVGTMHTNLVALPSDFKSISPVNSIQQVGSEVIPGLIFTSPEEMARIRNSAIAQTSLGLYHALLQRVGPTPSPANEAMAWVLEIAPEPDETVRDAFSGFYNARWKRLLDGDEIMVLPEQLEGIFTSLVEHYAKGRLEQDERGLTERLREWEADPSVIAAKRWDGSMQPTYGIMRGGAVQLARLGRHQSIPSRFTVEFDG